MKSESLKITKAIYTLTKDIFDGKVYPIIAEQSTTYPFMVIKRNSTDCTRVKDRLCKTETSYLELTIITDKYDQSIELAEKVKDQLDWVRGEVNDIKIAEMYVEASGEDYLNEAYVQKLSVSVTIQ